MTFCIYSTNTRMQREERMKDKPKKNGEKETQEYNRRERQANTIAE